MKITTIIPAYNAGRFIGDALDSVRGQTRPCDEVIVVDDCSTDDTADIATRRGAKRLATMSNSGHATARNVGIREATGDVIAWLDADDFWEPHHLATVVGLLEAHPEADVAFSGVRFVGARAGLWNRFPCNGAPKRVFWESLEGTVVPAMSAVTRTEALRKVGSFKESIRVAPDFDLWLRMSLCSRFVSTSEITANYRWHENQLSTTAPEKQQQSMAQARRDFYEALVQADEIELAEKVQATIVKSWERKLWFAWCRADMRVLRSLLSLRPIIPGVSDVGNRMARRCAFPGWSVALLHWVKAFFGAGERVSTKHQTGA